MLELIERLEKAEGPAIVLDAELFWVFDRPQATTAFWRGAMGLPRPLPDEFSRLPRGLGMASLEASAPPYTASVDYALALAERVLPGCRCLAGTRGLKGDRARAAVVPVVGRIVGGRAKTPALALCIAILRALRTTEQHSPAQQKKED